MEILGIVCIVSIISTFVAIYRLCLKADGRCKMSYSDIFISWMIWPLVVIVLIGIAAIFFAYLPGPEVMVEGLKKL